MPVVFHEPPPPRRVVRAGVGTAIALGASTAVLLFSTLTLGSAWLSRNDARGARPAVLASASSEIDLWVGELAPGVKAAISSPWSDVAWDRAQDDAWKRGLALGAEDVAFYELVAFNTSDAPAVLSFEEGALTLKARDGKKHRSLDLSALLRQSGVAASASATTLRALGADRTKVELPPHRMLRRPLAFPHRLSLAEVESAARADGSTFHRRRMRRGDWVALLDSPTLDKLEGL